MAKSEFVKANRKIAQQAVKTYEKIEEAVTGGYKKVEDTVVGGYTKIENAFVDRYLTHDGETAEDAKARLRQERIQRENDNSHGNP